MQTTIFKHGCLAKTEFEISRAIELRRSENGDIEIRVSAERGGSDAISLPMVLSPDKAVEMAHAVLAIDGSFDSIVERATKFGDD